MQPRPLPAGRPCRIKPSSTTPDAASQPWSSKVASKVAAYDSPARLVSRGGRRRGKPARADLLCLSAGCRVPDRAAARARRSRPGSKLARRPLRGLPASPTPGDCSSGCQSTWRSSTAGQSRSSMLRIAGAKKRTPRPARRAPAPPGGWATRPRRGGRTAARRRAVECFRGQRRVTAAKADRQLIAELAAGDRARSNRPGDRTRESARGRCRDRPADARSPGSSGRSPIPGRCRVGPRARRRSPLPSRPGRRARQSPRTDRRPVTPGRIGSCQADRTRRARPVGRQLDSDRVSGGIDQLERATRTELPRAVDALIERRPETPDR